MASTSKGPTLSRERDKRIHARGELRLDMEKYPLADLVLRGICTRGDLRLLRKGEGGDEDRGPYGKSAFHFNNIKRLPPAFAESEKVNKRLHVGFIRRTSILSSLALINVERLESSSERRYASYAATTLGFAVSTTVVHPFRHHGTSPARLLAIPAPGVDQPYTDQIVPFPGDAQGCLIPAVQKIRDDENNASLLKNVVKIFHRAFDARRGPLGFVRNQLTHNSQCVGLTLVGGTNFSIRSENSMAPTLSPFFIAEKARIALISTAMSRFS